MKFFPFPLIVYTISVAFGIFIRHYFQLPKVALYIVIAIVFCIWLWSFLNAKKKLIPTSFFGITTLIFCSTLGFSWLDLHQENQYKNHYSHFEKADNQIISAHILNEYRASAKNKKYQIEITSVDQKQTFGKALFYVPKTNQFTFEPDDQIIFSAQFSPLSKNLNNNSFDYGKYLENKQIYSVIFFKDSNLLQKGNQKSFRHYLYVTKKKITRIFESYSWKPETLAIVEALILGERFLLDDSLLKEYQNAGVMHVLAISGLHVGILYFVLAFLIKPLKRIKHGKYIQFGITIVFLWFFAFLTGLSPSISRAVTIFSLAAIGNLLNKTNISYNLVAVSALFLLLLNPSSLFDVGFQLSYAAVLSILIFNPLFSKFKVRKNRIIRYCIDLVLVSLAAQIGVLPLSIYYFNQFPTLFLFANLLVIPMITLILIGSIAILIFHWLPALINNFIASVIDYLVTFLNRYVSWLNQWDFFRIQNISFNTLLCVVSYIALISSAFWLYKKNYFRFQLFLSTILSFQLVYITTVLHHQSQQEFILFNSKQTVLIEKENQKAIAYTNAPDENNRIISDYKKQSFCNEMRIEPLNNTLIVKGKKCLILDSLGIYKTTLKPEIIILTQNCKINLERMIQSVRPKLIIADGSNSYYLLQNWKTTCRKEKIPFHATSEKGLYQF